MVDVCQYIPYMDTMGSNLVCVCVCGCWRFSLCPLTFNDFPGSFEMMTTRKDDIQRLTREEMMISWKRALPENGQTDNICGNFLALSTSGVMKIGFVSGYFPKKANIYWTGCDKCLS